MSPADPPLDIQFTLTREEAIALLERLRDDDEYQSGFGSDTRRFLKNNGIVITPEDAVPETADLPTPEQLDAAIATMTEDNAFWWPWIWVAIPWVGKSPPEAS